MKRQTKVLRRRLVAPKLDFGDLVAIAHALIKVRDRAFEQAEEARLAGNTSGASQLEAYGVRYNRILLRMNHPAAIEPARLQVCSKCREAAAAGAAGCEKHVSRERWARPQRV